MFDRLTILCMGGGAWSFLTGGVSYSSMMVCVLCLSREHFRSALLSVAG